MTPDVSPGSHHTVRWTQAAAEGSLETRWITGVRHEEMQINSDDTVIIMNEAHLHPGLCDYHPCSWETASVRLSGFSRCVPMTAECWIHRGRWRCLESNRAPGNLFTDKRKTFLEARPTQFITSELLADLSVKEKVDLWRSINTFIPVKQVYGELRVRLLTADWQKILITFASVGK